MDLSKINKVSRLDNFLPTKKLSELEPDKTYQVTELKTINTVFGVQTTMGLNNEFSVFLPARINKMLQDDQEQFQQMSQTSAENHLFVRYIGGKYHQCEFCYV